MSEPESIELAVGGDVLTGLPVSVKVSFFKAVGHLLGGLSAIPAAKLKQYAQAIEDTTVARSMAAAMVAKAVAVEASKDPILMQAAAEVFLPTALRKAKNRLGVAQSAAGHVAEKISTGNSGDEAASPEDDWMNSFTRFAEDASSERLQDLFGRILAGQVLHPGAFGFATLRTLSELDQAIASDFSQAWGKNVENAVDYSPEWRLGDGFSRWKRLSEAGLMAPTSIVQFLPEFNPIFEGKALWSPFSKGGTNVFVYFQQGCAASWEHIDFTRTGREIGSLLPRPDYEENIRQAAHRLPRSGVTRVELHTQGKTAEVLWQAAL